MVEFLGIIPNSRDMTATDVLSIQETKACTDLVQKTVQGSGENLRIIVCFLTMKIFNSEMQFT